MIKKILVSLLLLLSTKTFAMPSGGGGSDPCLTPFTPCWCQNNPGHPNCANANIPIDGHYWVLIVGGVLMGVFYLYKNRVR
jgi:hypothetical protein